MQEKSGTCCFVITGEFVTKFAREKVLEKHWRDALDFLLQNVVGMTPDIATAILSGTKSLVGRSDTEGITLVDDHAEKYKDMLNYIYSSLVLYGGNWYKPYAYVTNYGRTDIVEAGPRSFSTTPSQVGEELFQCRARHYCRNKTDKIIMLKVADDLEPVLFEPAEAPPFWYSTNRDPQVAANFSRLEEYGHLQWYGHSEPEIPLASNTSDAVKARELAKKLRDKAREEAEEEEERKRKFVPAKPDETLTAPCGWILPDGTFYGCAYSQHISLADWICETLGIKVDNGEKYGEKQGWLKIGQTFLGEKNDRTVFLRGENQPLTQKQIDTMFEWCKNTKTPFPKWMIEECDGEGHD
jgi:hypothetical protein